MGEGALDASAQQPWLQGPMWPGGAGCGQALSTGRAGAGGGGLAVLQAGWKRSPRPANCGPPHPAHHWPPGKQRPHSVCPPSEWARPPPCVKSRVMPSKFPDGSVASCGPPAAPRFQGAQHHPGPHGGWVSGWLCSRDVGGDAQHTPPRLGCRARA